MMLLGETEILGGGEPAGWLMVNVCPTPPNGVIVITAVLAVFTDICRRRPVDRSRTNPGGSRRNRYPDVTRRRCPLKQRILISGHGHRARISRGVRIGRRRADVQDPTRLRHDLTSAGTRGSDRDIRDPRVAPVGLAATVYESFPLPIPEVARGERQPGLVGTCRPSHRRIGGNHLNRVRVAAARDGSR